MPGATVTLRDNDGEPFHAWLRYPGRRRPGQWSERAREKRARRLERARERRRPRVGRGAGRSNRAIRRAEERRFAMLWAEEAKIAPLPGEPTKALLARAQAIDPFGPLPF